MFVLVFPIFPLAVVSESTAEGPAAHHGENQEAAGQEGHHCCGFAVILEALRIGPGVRRGEDAFLHGSAFAEVLGDVEEVGLADRRAAVVLLQLGQVGEQPVGLEKPADSVLLLTGLVLCQDLSGDERLVQALFKGGERDLFPFFVELIVFPNHRY